MKWITEMWNSLGDSLGSSLPNVLGAVLMLLIGLFVARWIKKLVAKGLSKIKLNETLNNRGIKFNAENFIAKIIYFVLVIYVFMLVLELLGINSVLAPLQELLSKFMRFLPNLVAAVIIGYIGYVIANFVRDMVGSAAGWFSRAAEKIGMKSSDGLINIAKQVCFLIVFIPILIVALDTLQLKAISDPASNMLAMMMGALPNIFAAVIILLVFFVIGKFLVGIITELLISLGLDNLTTKLGVRGVIGESGSLSKIAGNLLFFYLMFFGIISALEKLEMFTVTLVLSDLLALSGNILLGLLIMAIGNMISNLVHQLMVNSTSSKGLAMIAKMAIIGLFFAIGLQTMGIADTIVDLAFGLTLGAIAVAFALSFGLGGREAAGQSMAKFLNKFKSPE